MKELFTSATRIVLIIMTVALVHFIPMENLNKEAFELFKYAYTSIVSFYFGQKIHSINKQ